MDEINMDEFKKLEHIAAKFLEGKVSWPSYCPAFFAYSMLKRDEKAQLLALGYTELTYEEVKRIIKEYLSDLREIEPKIYRVRVLCEIEDKYCEDFYYHVISKAVYFVPIDRHSLEEIEKELDFVNNSETKIEVSERIQRLKLNNEMLKFKRSNISNLIY